MAGGINLIKLSVGSKSPADLKKWQDSRPDPLAHVTRMWPRRADEIAGLGSIYWVIAGEIRLRQPIIRFDERIGEDGIRRCAIILAREYIQTRPTPRRPFQGWRYLETKDAPADTGALGDETLPEELESLLSELGVG